MTTNFEHMRQCYKFARLVQICELRIWQQISTLEQIHDFLNYRKKALAKLCSKGFNAKM
jgi:hypothetical protein